MSSQPNQVSNQSDVMKTMWCFPCDTAREGKVGDKCPRCGTMLAEAFLKPQMNVERLAFVCILILVVLVSGLLFFGLGFGDRHDVLPSLLSLIGTVLSAVFALSFMALCSYGLVLVLGHYFGMPSGKALFTRYVPSDYPEAKRPKFSLRRLGIEAIQSIGIVAGGLLIYLVVSVARGCTDR
jgi:hypothetical protein